jgi:ribosomal protein L29
LKRRKNINTQRRGGRENKMAVLKNKDVLKMSEQEMDEKLIELRVMLVKKATPTGKGGKVKNKEIKKAIARILTFKNQKSKTREKPAEKKSAEKKPRKIKSEKDKK